MEERFTDSIRIGLRASVSSLCDHMEVKDEFNVRANLLKEKIDLREEESIEMSRFSTGILKNPDSAS
ncbi:hypothetical protein Tco_1234917 [Tanacetum coccineum]